MSVDRLRQRKVIFLSGFNPDKAKNHPAPDEDLFFVASWAGMIARRYQARFPDADVEIWRTEPGIFEETSKIVFGLRGVIFPYRFPLVKQVLTLAMFLRLRRLQVNHRLILHYHCLFDVFSVLAPFLFPRARIIYSHHGSLLPEKGSLQDLLVRLAYGRVHAVTYLTHKCRDYLLGLPRPPKIVFLPVGADFDQFKPMNKAQLRKKYGLDPTKVYAIYVGNFYKLKGVDLILKEHSHLAQKHDFSVIFVGGSHDEINDQYRAVAASGCPYFGPQLWTEMVHFYNLADFYVHPAFHPRFGGMDVSWMEALACNVPVLSPQLSELNGGFEGLGVGVKSPEEFCEKLDWMISHFKDFTRCREIAVNQVDGKGVLMDRLRSLYGDLDWHDGALVTGARM